VAPLLVAVGALYLATTVLPETADKVIVEKEHPKITLVWMYEGHEFDDRRKIIASLDYPDFEVITPDEAHSLEHLTDLMAADSEVCIFWSDDGKPVGPDFLKIMIRPLYTDAPTPIVMHLWSGNAVAMRRAALENVQRGIFRLVGNSFMKLAIFFLEVGSEVRGIRSQIAVSSTDQVAPICRQAVTGRVC
jgi:hypothetical protein